MLYLCLKILKYKKKEVLTVSVSVFLLSLISVVAFTAAKDIIEKKRAEAFSSYGTFVAGGSTNSKEDIPFSDELTIGTYTLLGTFNHNEKIIPVGTADDCFYDLSSCKLLEGAKPYGKKEIAIQKYVAKLLNKKIGDSLHLTANGVADTDFTIVGILNNYSMNLSTSAYDTENSMYPSAIISSTYANEKNEISYLIGFDNKDEIIFDDIALIQRIDNFVGQENITFYNDNLFYTGFMYCNEIINFSYLFTFLIFLLTSLICSILYKLFFKNIRRDYSVFSAMGGNEYIKRLSLLQISFVTLFSFFASVASFSFVTFIVFKANEALALKGFGFLCAWYTAYFIVVLTVTLIYLKNISLKSIRENLTLPVSSKKKTLVSNILAVIKYFSVFIITFVSIFLVNTLYESFAGLPDYDLISKEVGLSEVIKGYTINYNTSFSYDIGQVNTILNNYSDLKVELKANTANNMLVHKKDYENSFLEAWNKLFNYGDTEVEDSYYIRNWPSEADNYIPITNVQYLILSNTEYANVMKLTSSEEIDNEVLVYVPSDNHNIDANKLIFAGFKNNGNLHFLKYNIKVNHVLSKQFSSVIKDNTKKFSENLFNPYDEDKITVLLNYDRLSDTPFVNGYESVSVTLEESFKDYEAIDDDMAALQSDIQGGKLHSKKEDERKAESYNDYIRRVSIALIVITIILAFVYSVCSAILYIKDNRRSMGIMMILGKTASKIALEKSISNISLYITSILIGVLIISLCVYDGSNLRMCLIAGGAAICTATVIMLVDDIIINLFIKRVKLKECIYKV